MSHNCSRMVVLLSQFNTFRAKSTPILPALSRSNNHITYHICGLAIGTVEHWEGGGVYIRGESQRRLDTVELSNLLWENQGREKVVRGKGSTKRKGEGGYGCSIVWGEELVDVSLDDAGLSCAQVAND